MSAVHVPVNQHLLTNQEFRIKQHCGINIVTDVIKIMNHQSNARNASIDIIKSLFSLSIPFDDNITQALGMFLCARNVDCNSLGFLGFLFTFT